ncbi:MAG: indole-3-glycerol phosphate synthase TrpC [Gemmatimonadota bacterium]
MQAKRTDPSDGPGRGADVLQRIVETKRSEVEALRRDAGSLRDQLPDAPAPMDFAAALAAPGTVSVIAEVKRRSPGAGAIEPGLDPVRQARAYEKGGAAAVSVLTDREYFSGDLRDLSRVRASVELPVLRKDFVIDELQIVEARAAGADAILLIVRILDDASLRAFRELAEDLGMSALVEVHDRQELQRAVKSGAGVIGINNRDLRTFETRVDVTLDLLEDVPREVVIVSESGISERSQVERLGGEGVDAILVGEALVRSGDPVAATRGLCGVEVAVRRGAPIRDGNG